MQFGAQLSFPLPAAAREPFAAQVADFSSGREFGQFGEGAGQDRAAALPLAGSAERAADRMIHECRARRGDCPHNVMNGADDQRGNTSAFDYVSDETDGLVAERSVWNQEGEIGVRLKEFARDGWRKLVFDLLVRAHPAHK